MLLIVLSGVKLLKMLATYQLSAWNFTQKINCRIKSIFTTFQAVKTWLLYILLDLLTIHARQIMLILDNDMT